MQNPMSMDARLARVGRYLLGCEAWRAFDPKAIVKELPCVFVLSRAGTDEDPRLLVKLVGSELDRAFGRSVVGHYLDEFVHGPRGNNVLIGFYDAARTREALWMREVVEIKDKPARFVEGVLVPLEPDRICGALAFGELAYQQPTSFERRPLAAMLDGTELTSLDSSGHTYHNPTATHS